MWTSGVGLESSRILSISSAIAAWMWPSGVGIESSRILSISSAIAAWMWPSGVGIESSRILSISSAIAAWMWTSGAGLESSHILSISSAINGCGHLVSDLSPVPVALGIFHCNLGAGEWCCLAGCLSVAPCVNVKLHHLYGLLSGSPFSEYVQLQSFRSQAASVVRSKDVVCTSEVIDVCYNQSVHFVLRRLSASRSVH